MESYKLGLIQDCMVAIAEAEEDDALLESLEIELSGRSRKPEPDWLTDWLKTSKGCSQARNFLAGGLGQEIRDKIEALSDEKVAKLTRGLLKEARDLTQQRARHVLASREKFPGERGELARERAEIQPDAFSREELVYYCEKLSKLLPKILRRAQQLEPLPVLPLVPTFVQNYLEEASKCYLYGRSTACLMVCRSALEFALKDCLEKKGHAPDLEALRIGKEDSLKNIIGLAKEKLPWTLRCSLDAADQVRDAARRAVHDNAPAPEVCKDMFILTRGVLKDLYSSLGRAASEAL